MKDIPIIILGAGASHDYNNSLHSIGSPNFRPPLTKDLVQKDFLDSGLASLYPEAGLILSELEGKVNYQGISFEQALGNIKETWGNNYDRKIQFIALAFYLKHLFAKLSNKFQTNTSNNYHVLINKIKDISEGRAVIIDFNYDTILEKSIVDNKFESMRSYIERELKLIKVHGSHDWSYIMTKPDDIFSPRATAPYDYLKKDPDLLNSLMIKGTKPYHEIQLKTSNNPNGLLQFPALAIPLPNKQSFICPQDHIKIMEEALSGTNKILIIGWSAGDPNMIDTFKKIIRKPVDVTIVCGAGGTDVIKRLESIKEFNPHIESDGFTDFINNDNFCNNFFK